MVRGIEQRAAAIAVWDWEGANEVRTAFDTYLAGEPTQESDARRIARQYGV